MNKFSFLCALAIFSASAGAATTTNKVESVNVFGLLRVASSLATTPVAVNFGAIAGSNVVNGSATNLMAIDQPIAVSNIVKTATLTAGDKLYVYNQTTGAYDYYLLSDAGDGTKYWAPKTTATVNGGSGTITTTATDASIFTQFWGAAVWVYRQNTDSNIYVFGQVHSSSVTQTVVTVGNNLVGAPTAAVFGLNSIAWPEVNASTVSNNVLLTVGDVISVVSSDGGDQTLYYYVGSGWGHYKTTTVTENGRSTVGTAWTTNDCTVPAGQGFWYKRAGSTSLTITW